MPHSVMVIGCGVSGLSCALQLLERGFRVNLFGEATADNTTSSIAAAFWYPFQVEHEQEQDLQSWAEKTLARFQNLLSSEYRIAAGLTSVRGVELVQRKLKIDPLLSTIWWHRLNVDFSMDSTFPAEHGIDGEFVGLEFTVPVLEMPKYLEFLLAELRSKNVVPHFERFDSIKDVVRSCKDDCIVNCVGLGAGPMVPDQLVYPVEGHVVWISKINFPKLIFIQSGDYRDRPLYVVPRSCDIVLGGSTVVRPSANAYSVTIPDIAECEIIRDRCVQMFPQLQSARVLQYRRGLRPKRKGSICLCTDMWYGRPVVHNYGHGGSGVTLSWGCAEKVADLCAEILK